MDYNTQREKLRLPEYGRNVQIMVNHAKGIENREDRNKAAETIISVMASMHPPLKDSRDYKHKLWDHLHIIADFALDVDSPFEAPQKEAIMAKPERLPYPQERIKYQHYGKVVGIMLDKAMAMEDGEQKDVFIKHIANHMKLSYITWNKDSVPDTIIFKTIEDMTEGAIKVKEGTVLFEYKEPIKQNYSSGKKKKGKKK